MKSASHRPRLRFLDTIVRPTLFFGITAMESIAGLLEETARRLHRSMMRKRLRLFITGPTGHGMSIPRLVGGSDHARGLQLAQGWERTLVVRHIGA